MVRMVTVGVARVVVRAVIWAQHLYADEYWPRLGQYAPSKAGPASRRKLSSSAGVEDVVLVTAGGVALLSRNLVVYLVMVLVTVLVNH